MRHKLAITAVMGVCLAFTLRLPGRAQQPIVRSPLFYDISKPLGQLIPIRIERKGPRRENVVHHLRLLQTKGALEDPVVQSAATRTLPLEIAGFEGLGQGLKYESPVSPPDTTGAAGRRHFIEWVNTAFIVFDKDTQKPVYGPADGKTLWSGFAATETNKSKPNSARSCAATNDGDPIVIYDRLADRWILSQFSFSQGPPYLQCIAVSMTSDPLGRYARYAYSFDAFNDYGKLGVWPNAYYATFNMFESPALDAPAKGAQVCAFDRRKMLAGESATMVCFKLPQQGLLPADLDGTVLPPEGANAPGYFLALGVNRLDFWTMRPVWSAPKKSTLLGPREVAKVRPFVSACNDKTCEIIPQKHSTTLLDSLGERLMYRLAYRNLGDHQAFVVNHAVQVPGTQNQNQGVTAFRWYELRPSAGNLIVHDTGTYRPNALSRWMASIAMDKVGNIAVAYSVSASDAYPSARVTGRLADDKETDQPFGQEYSLAEGASSQSDARWGDYTTMSLDPVDDCTFWFVSEYLANDDPLNWHTHISRLKFKACK
jgi:hypothetical protein